MELHYSQTDLGQVNSTSGFTTLWNYTILKPNELNNHQGNRFTTLWNYTILKHRPSTLNPTKCFTTLWNYTILKPI